MKRSSILLGLTMLAGCDMAPHYRRPALPVSATLPQGPSYAAEPAVATAGATVAPVAAADVAWRDFFVDDRLRRLVAITLENNRDLRIAVANVAQARAQYRIQRADLLPTVGGNASATFQKSPAGLAGVGTTTTGAGTGTGTGAGTGAGATTGAVAAGSSRIDLYQVGVGISSWEIDLFGRIRNLTRSAQEQYFASEANAQAARTMLIAEVVTAWLTMAADQDRLRIATETAKAFGQTLDITRGRANEGVASNLELNQAQTTFDQARSDIAAATTAVARDQNALDLLAGTTIAQDLLPGGLPDRDPTITDLPAGLTSDVLLRRPDIAAAEHQLRAAYADIGAARAAFFPKLSLTAAFGTLSLGLSNLFKSGSETWSVAPSATLPIFDYGRNLGNLRYAQATRDAMLATYEKAIQTGFREVADALARRGTIGQQLDAQLSLAKASGAALEIAQARYSEGVDPFLNTLDAQRAYYTAQQSLVATRLERQSNAVELYRALGGGLK